MNQHSGAQWQLVCNLHVMTDSLWHERRDVEAWPWILRGQEANGHLKSCRSQTGKHVSRVDKLPSEELRLRLLWNCYVGEPFISDSVFLLVWIHVEHSEEEEKSGQREWGGGRGSHIQTKSHSFFVLFFFFLQCDPQRGHRVEMLHMWVF